MNLAILTDIHANREAFEAVLEDARARGADRFVLLGDVVGYGPDPVWCCETARDLLAEGALAVRGNHDAAAAGAAEPLSGNARLAMDWTRTQLSAEHKACVGGLPLTATVGDFLFVHGSASDPGAFSYVTSDTRAAPSFAASAARVIFCGHTHVPLLTSANPHGQVREQAFRPGFPIPLLSSRRWLAVVGSVGQPRDGDTQAAWAMLDTETHELTFRRTPYDVARTVEKLRTAGLPEALARRLLEGR